jgi:hypothetical protein
MKSLSNSENLPVTLFRKLFSFLKSVILKIIPNAAYDSKKLFGKPVMIYTLEKIKNKVTAKGTQNINSFAASVQFLELERINKEVSKNFLVAFLFHCDSPQGS